EVACHYLFIQFLNVIFQLTLITPHTSLRMLSISSDSVLFLIRMPRHDWRYLRASILSRYWYGRTIPSSWMSEQMCLHSRGYKRSAHPFFQRVVLHLPPAMNNQHVP